MPRHRPYQADTIERGRRQNLLLAHGCGVGKTREGMFLVFHNPSPALILAPVSVLETVWMEHYREWMPKSMPTMLWNRSKAVKQRLLEERHKTYLCSYETAKNLYPQICAKGFRTLLADESSKMRSYTSGTTGMMLAYAGIHTRGCKFPLLRTIPHRYAMSGTPAPNSRLEYWPQIQFVSGNYKAFDPNFYNFRRRYFTERPVTRYAYEYKFRNAMEEQFNQAMAPWIDVIKTEDVLPHLKSAIEVREVVLSRKERNAYEEMHKQLVVEGDGWYVATKNALTKAVCLREITSGFLYAGDMVRTFGNSKITEMLRLTREIGDNQVIIWYNYNEERARILKALKGKAVWCNKPGAKRTKALADFKSGKYQYLIANPKSLKLGQNMQFVHHMIFFSLSASYDDYEQCMRRILRGGQDHKCMFYLLVAKKTYDEALLKMVKTKETRANVTLDYFRNRR